MSKKYILLKYYVPVLVWMGVIFYLSSTQGDNKVGNPTVWFYVQRKGAHIFEYFVLTLLIFRLLNAHKFSRREKMVGAVIFPLAYAVSDEFHQLFIRGRTGKLSDIGIDLFGIVLMMVVINYHLKERNRKKRLKK